jgi:hypothetical protein
VLPYAQAAFRPPAPSPAFGSESRFLGQVPLVLPQYKPPPFFAPLESRALGKPGLGQTFDEILNWSPVCGDLLRLTFHGGTAWLGTYVGLKETGAVKWIAWILGFGNGLAAIADVISLIKRASGTHPPPKANSQ